jgi:hypothetical protein
VLDLTGDGQDDLAGRRGQISCRRGYPWQRNEKDDSTQPPCVTRHPEPSLRQQWQSSHPLDDNGELTEDMAHQILNDFDATPPSKTAACDRSSLPVEEHISFATRSTSRGFNLGFGNPRLEGLQE